MTDPSNDPVFEALLEHLRRSRGFDFTGYKRSSLMRRVKKRMQSLSLESFADYSDYLEVHSEEFAALFNTILINVTGFFRDPSAWEYLSQEVIPRIVQAKTGAAQIRIWSAGCSTGEEAYTLAMLMAEQLGAEQFRHQVKIYATDVDEDALVQARLAVYTGKDLEGVPLELRERYFEPVGNRFTFRQDLRRSVIFGRHDLVQDAPISRLDLLVCRNALMYFNAETQARILARFHFALNDEGFLFLGKAEMMLTHTNLFTPINLKHRVFSKVTRVSLRDRLLVMAQPAAADGDNQAKNSCLQETAFDAASVAQIVIDTRSNLVLANYQTRSQFNLVTSDLGRPIQDLEISYRPLELRSRIEQVCQERRNLIVNNVQRTLPNEQIQYLDVQFVPLLKNDSALLGISILFTEVTHYQRLQEELQRSNQDLETANEELQSSNEELETTNEELQSTNEELETTNEELQATNEELETINEELQSTNEELETMNEELRQRTGELNDTNAFLESILSSLNGAVIVIDRKLNILVWNNKAENLWGLRTDEATGESFLDLDIGLPLDQLRTPMLDCLAGRNNHLELVLEAVNRRGRSFQCFVTVSPLVGVEKNRQGVILLMGDLDNVRNNLITDLES